MIKQICSDNVALLKKHKTDRKQGGYIQCDEGYGDTVHLMNKIAKMLPTLRECSDKTFIADHEKSSWQKILFRNGIYDGITSTFHSANENGFQPDVLFFNRVEMDYKALTVDNEDYIQDIKQRLFIDPLGRSKGEYFLLVLSKGAFGDGHRDAEFDFIFGEPNSGKTTMGKLLKGIFGSMCEQFSSQQVKRIPRGRENIDPAQAMRWVLEKRYARFLICSEANCKDELDGFKICQLASGGDLLEARHHREAECNFLLWGWKLFFCNDPPKITPFQKEHQKRVRFIKYEKTFVDKPLEDCNELEMPMDKKLDEEIVTPRFKMCFTHLLLQT